MLLRWPRSSGGSLRSLTVSITPERRSDAFDEDEAHRTLLNIQRISKIGDAIRIPLPTPLPIGYSGRNCGKTLFSTCQDKEPEFHSPVPVCSLSTYKDIYILELATEFRGELAVVDGINNTRKTIRRLDEDEANRTFHKIQRISSCETKIGDAIPL
ncbi:hypothetical protein HanRHA438_Chr08g0341311 [Helianthus annuus]|nr:hypothetical protein HanRHA438_Chr08g0341311 [Helianthus annuus]